MGWLLTIWLYLPLAGSELEVRMWFSQEHYCNFAREKFVEIPMLHRLSEGELKEARVRNLECRELREDEAALIPPHMRN